MKNSFRYYYDSIDDVLAIYNDKECVNETVEFSELINLDLNKSGDIVGVEIFEASKFFSAFNPNINKEFLENVETAFLDYKEHRNMWLIVITMVDKHKTMVSQPMPPLLRMKYVSPLLAS